MNYTIHQLKVFLEVVKNGSITKTASEMHMTQPAVSIQLKNFQAQFDVPLTEIVGRKLFVTDFGWAIAELAENVIRELDAIKYKTREYSGLLIGKLRISSASTGKYIIPYFLSGFLNEHRGVDVVLDVTNRTKVIRSLKNNEIDFALVSVLPEKIVVEEEPLMENRLYMIGNTDTHNKDQPYIFREEGSATRLAMDRYLERGKERKKMELTSSEAVKQAVIAGLGVSIVALIGIKNELFNKDLFILPARSLPICNNWRLIWLKEKKLSPIANAYLEYVRDQKDRIIRDHFEWYRNFEG